MSTDLQKSLLVTTADVLGSVSAALPSSLTKFHSVPSAHVTHGLFAQEALAPALRIIVPDFGIDVGVPITDISPEMESGRVLLKAVIERDSRVVVTLRGNPLNGSERFYVRQVDLNLETSTELARLDFIITTIRASLGLANEVNLKLPDFQLDLRMRFNESLLQMSQLLRRRQIAFRLMVIERATGLQFKLPLDISGEDVEHIALIYHAIIERSFEWPIETSTVFLPATEEGIEQLLEYNKTDNVALGPYPQARTLFGYEIWLGSAIVTIEEAIIGNFEQALDELKLGDGHRVAIYIHSRIGLGRWTAPEAPRLPDPPWDSNMQHLVDLERPLDARLIKRYNALAAATLEGLSENEKAEITARPEIGNAFLIEDSSLENT
jgi:hypothetical protein